MKSKMISCAKAKQCRNIDQFKKIWSFKDLEKQKVFNYWNFERIVEVNLKNIKAFKSLHAESESKYFIGNDYNYDHYKLTFAAVHSHTDFSGKVKENFIRIITPPTESLTHIFIQHPLYCIIYTVGGKDVHVLSRMVLFLLMGISFRGWKNNHLSLYIILLY